MDTVSHELERSGVPDPREQRREAYVNRSGGTILPSSRWFQYGLRSSANIGRCLTLHVSS